MSARLHKLVWGPLELSLEWRTTLFVFLLFPGLVALGFWQLERADEKRALSVRHTERLDMVALSGADLFRELGGHGEAVVDPLDFADRRVVLTGKLRADDYVLLDNRVKGGRFGYEVVVFIATSEGRIPVNLGWIPGDSARRSIPDPHLKAGSYTLSGRLYVPQKAPYLLAVQATPSTLPAVVQAYEAPLFGPGLSGILGAAVLPAMVRIAADDPLARIADWPLVNQSPEKHTGYAVQWFTMAAALMLAFIFRSSNLLPLLLGRWGPARP